MTEGVQKSLVSGSSVISQHGLWLHYGRVAKNLGERNEVPVIVHTHGMLEPWALNIQATAVVAHAQHGRLGLVAEIIDMLPASLSVLTADPGPQAGTLATSYDLTVCASLLLALAMTDIDQAERAADARAARSGARMIALAERFGLKNGLQPTMSAARARQAAQDADGPAYADAVSAYAGLDPEALRAAARAALRARAQLSG